MHDNRNTEIDDRQQTSVPTPPDVNLARNGSAPWVPPSERVVRHIEAELGEQADFALNDYVDPDALDALFADRLDGRPRVSGSVVFTCRGLLVTVHSNGAVDLRRLS